MDVVRSITPNSLWAAVPHDLNLDDSLKLSVSDQTESSTHFDQFCFTPLILTETKPLSYSAYCGQSENELLVFAELLSRVFVPF